MPRSGRGSAPSRPAARPAAAPPAPARNPQQQQTRPMSTAPTQTAPPQAQAPVSQGPGLFGQMASTAAGVAVGSSIGHAIGGFFGGGSSQAAAPAEQQYQQPVDNYSQAGGMYNTNAGTMQQEASGPCANDIKSFTNCMNQNSGDLNICGWYLEQLKACQQAAKNY